MRPSFELTPVEAVADLFAESDAVILGRIVRIDSGMEPIEGGFIWRRRLFIAVEQVLKGDTKSNRIELEPGNVEGLPSGSFDLWRESGTHVIFFLTDGAQRKLERKHPDSAALAKRHEWMLTPRVPGYGLPVLDAASDLASKAHIQELRRAQSLEAMTRNAEVVVLGVWERGEALCKVNGRYCSWIRVQRVLKGKVTPGLLAAFSKGFATYPNPKAPALFFLSRENSGAFEVTSAGVRPIRGERLRHDGLSIAAAIARIEAAVR